MNDEELESNNFIQREDLEQVIERINKTLLEIYCEVTDKDSYEPI